ncbi:MAG: hypothetical protein ACTHLW_16225 [Verrucomicrobiota bacterium]
MIRNKILLSVSVLAAMVVGFSNLSAAPKKAAPEFKLSEQGAQLEAKYAATLTALKAEIAKALPPVAEQQKAALEKAQVVLRKAEADANASQELQSNVKTAEGLVAHAKGKWIGGAEKGIAEAEAALKKATSDAQREAARKNLAKWQADKEDGLKALQERQAALDKAKAELQGAGQANQLAQAALAKARAEESNAAEALLAEVDTFLSNDKLDAKLAKATVLAEATPRGLAVFAEQGFEQQALVEKLLADDTLMKEMLIAGGAKFGRYGQAMQIYSAIQQASPKAREGLFQRLALATSLEHAMPIKQSNAQDQKDAPATVDPVRRYLHYQKAYLDNELDPAFKNFSAWEYRMVVGCDAPDEILAWGREMLRNYRPDHIANPNYGWRYSVAVRTEVPYGSQNVQYDLPSLNTYQNIPKDGGVCGRRAFFGRFILRSFGIPVWGVTQHAHAALSHWTPNGWVVNLGAGFNASWWDKDEAPRSGSDFLLESQARAKARDYLKVLRAEWVSRTLGEQAYNDRKKVAGDFWSRVAHYQSIVLASKAVELGPLGQELAEANEAKVNEKVEQAKVTEADKRVVLSQAGTITIPAVACGKTTGPALLMKSFSSGMQMNCSGGFKTQYVFEAPQAGKYALAARVATLQEGQKFLFAVNDARQPVEIAVPYTIGMWQQTRSVEISLVKGQNVLNFAVQDGSRGVTLKDITVSAVK